MDLYLRLGNSASQVGAGDVTHLLGVVTKLQEQLKEAASASASKKPAEKLPAMPGAECAGSNDPGLDGEELSDAEAHEGDGEEEEQEDEREEEQEDEKDKEHESEQGEGEDEQEGSDDVHAPCPPKSKEDDGTSTDDDDESASSEVAVDSEAEEASSAVTVAEQESAKLAATLATKARVSQASQRPDAAPSVPPAACPEPKEEAVVNSTTHKKEYMRLDFWLHSIDCCVSVSGEFLEHSFACVSIPRSGLSTRERLQSGSRRCTRCPKVRSRPLYGCFTGLWFWCSHTRHVALQSAV